MGHLCEQLGAGRPRDEALCQARQHLMETGSCAHPAFWAAFQLHGRAD